MTDKRKKTNDARPFLLTSGDIVFTKRLRDRLAEIEKAVKENHDARLKEGLISLHDYATAVKNDLENMGAVAIQKAIDDLYIFTVIYDGLGSPQEKDEFCDAFYAAQGIPAICEK